MYFYKFNLNGESGYEIVIPMQINEKIHVYIILGWIPFDAKSKFELKSNEESKWIDINKIKKFAIPAPIRSYLENG